LFCCQVDQKPEKPQAAAAQQQAHKERTDETKRLDENSSTPHSGIKWEAWNKVKLTKA
jgi:hypothetical protein